MGLCEYTGSQCLFDCFPTDMTFRYLFITTIPGIFEGVYHQRVGIAGLHYLAAGIGLTGASQINARMLDYIYHKLKERNGGEGKPEFRLRMPI